SDPYTAEHIDDSFVGINPFFFGAAARASMSAQAQVTGQMDPFLDLTGPGEISEQVATFAFLAGNILPQVLPQFTSPQSDLLSQVNFLAVASYVQLAQQASAYIGSTPALVRDSWRTATPLLSTGLPGAA